MRPISTCFHEYPAQPGSPLGTHRAQALPTSGFGGATCRGGDTVEERSPSEGGPGYLLHEDHGGPATSHCDPLA